MVSLFKKSSTKNPTELVKTLKEALSDRSLSLKKAMEEATKCIGGMRVLMHGDVEHADEQIVLLSNEIYNSDLLSLIIQNLSKFDFEAKKDVVYVVTHLLRRQVGNRFPTVEYMSRNGPLLEMMVGLYEESEYVITIGAIIRECIKHEALSKLILSSAAFWNFFRFVESPKFDVASDTFTTFRELLTAHKEQVVQFLEQNYDTFFEHYNELLQSQNFVAKRQSLKLLGELLLDRTNFSIMTKYISSSQKLKQVMNLLRDKSRPIQYEAFHVFKVFVANPNKPQPILDILVNNKDALVMFLENFQNDRSEEEQFKEEKAFLIKQIQALQK